MELHSTKLPSFLFLPVDEMGYIFKDDGIFNTFSTFSTTIYEIQGKEIINIIPWP
jgi:hypothetical protein